MSRVVFLEDRCKGCLLCVAVCPSQILRPSGRSNRNGYEMVEMSPEGKCIGCASCAFMCPDVAIRVFRTSPAGKRRKA